MRSLVLATLFVLPLGASAATNLIGNGSFESGLAGWTVSGAAGDGFPATVITYNSASPYPTGAFGEPVPVDNAVNVGPDAAGTKALYFASDFSTQVISQVVTVVTGGLHTFGIDVYLPANGYANTVEATMGVTLGTKDFGTYALSTFAATQWIAGATPVTLAPGSYTFALAFTSNGAAAKDIVVDKVFLISEVPEAGTSSMLCAGLGMLGFAAARRRTRH